MTPSSVPNTSVADAVPGVTGCEPYFDLSKYKDHEYEVCVAYISNSAEIALQGLYKFGNSRIGYLSDAAKHHFETRYWNQPRQAIEQEVASWPKTSDVTGNKVEDSITLVSVTSSLAADRGLVQTRESWQVTAPDGTILHNEPLHTKDITMCRGRLPGHPLHEWMVVATSQQPNFDCIGFDKSNGIAP